MSIFKIRFAAALFTLSITPALSLTVTGRKERRLSPNGEPGSTGINTGLHIYWNGGDQGFLKGPVISSR